MVVLDFDDADVPLDFDDVDHVEDVSLSLDDPNLFSLDVLLAIEYVDGCNLSGWAGLGQNLNNTRLYSQNSHEAPHLSMYLLLGIAFFCLSFSSLSTFSRLKMAHPMRC